MQGKDGFTNVYHDKETGYITGGEIHLNKDAAVPNSPWPTDVEQAKAICLQEFTNVVAVLGDIADTTFNSEQKRCALSEDYHQTYPPITEFGNIMIAYRGTPKAVEILWNKIKENYPALAEFKDPKYIVLPIFYALNAK